MNFKKLLGIALLAVVGVVSCSSCASKPPPGPVVVVNPDASVDASPDTGPTTVAIKGPNWELTLPGPGWESNEACTKDGCQMVLVNQELKNAVLVVSKAYTGSVNEYVVMAVRGAKEAGANLLSTKQVVLNGHNFVLLELSRDADKVWLWFTILNGHGTELSCGGMETENRQHDLCFGVASTFKVN